MQPKIKNKSKVRLGAVLVCYGFFAHALDFITGEFEYVKALRKLIETSRVKIDVIQVPLFPGHLVGSGYAVICELFARLQEMVDEVVAVLMLTVDPLDPANKAVAIETLRNGLLQAGRLGVTTCSGTSFEAWGEAHRSGKKPLTGAELDRAIALLVEIHVEAVKLAKAEGCTVKFFDMEYLRTIEFGTFTNMEIAYRVIKAINDKLGYVFCRLLDDTAHAADSGLSRERQNRVRTMAAGDGVYGTCHASEPTTRGELGSTGNAVHDGITSMVCSGQITCLMVEIFNPEDPVLQFMRENIPGFGLQSIPDMNQAMANGLALVQNELNTLVDGGALCAA